MNAPDLPECPPGARGVVCRAAQDALELVRTALELLGGVFA